MRIKMPAEPARFQAGNGALVPPGAAAETQGVSVLTLNVYIQCLYTVFMHKEHHWSQKLLMKNLVWPQSRIFWPGSPPQRQASVAQMRNL